MALQGHVVEARAESLEISIRAQRKQNPSASPPTKALQAALAGIAQLKDYIQVRIDEEGALRGMWRVFIPLSFSLASKSDAQMDCSRALMEILSSLQETSTETGGLEQQTRGLLASARIEQQAGQRALLLQIRRMQALEAMRLADVQARNHMPGC